MSKIAPYYKALAGALVPSVALFVASVSDGSVTSAEWVRIVTAFVAGGLGVYAAPKNAPRKKRGQRGAYDLVGLLVVVILVIVVIWLILALVGR